MNFQRLSKQKGINWLYEKINLWVGKHYPLLSKKIKFRLIFKKKLNLKDPKLFSEKIQWLIFNYIIKNDQAIEAADKVGVRAFLDKKGLGHLKTPIIGIYDNVDEIDWKTLPNSFVIKKSNASGQNAVVLDKKSTDLKALVQVVKKWKKTQYGYRSGEMHYEMANSKLIVEPYIEGIDNDYKIFFLNGIPKMVQINRWFDYNNDLTVGHRKTAKLWVDLEGNILEIGVDDGEKIDKESFGTKVELPSSFKKMIEYGRILSDEFPLVRVDFFEIDDSPILGELTFSPDSGLLIYNEHIQSWLGKELSLPVV